MSSERRFVERFRVLRRVLHRMETAQIRSLGASAISVVFRTPVLLLHTTGRRSGLERTTPLAFHRDQDGSLLIVGGASGQARTPDWVANLRTSAAAYVTIRRDRYEVRVEELRGDERLEVWARLATEWPRIDAYQMRARREVPVFRLVRTVSEPV
ncbi:MAG: nitroreductase/quinone reductase family protein [Microthrixaceae bacterium]